jgi:hypothetical protein
VVYKVNPNTGDETVLTTFSGAHGGAASPIGTLARDSSGNLYGTTLKKLSASPGETRQAEMWNRV